MDLNEIHRYIDLLHGDDNGNIELFEIRCLGKQNNRKVTYSGYFDSFDELAKQITHFEDLNIYIVLNKIKDACKSREQYNLIKIADTTTSDNDIERRKWILIDLDVDRPAGTNSTNEEKETAHKYAGLLFNALTKYGFDRPIVADSGNGYHLLLNCDMLNNSDTTKLVQEFLKAIEVFTSLNPKFEKLKDYIKVDISVSNAARISRLAGTYGRKGNNSQDRPQRQSKILLPHDYEPLVCTPNPTTLFQRFIKEYLPEPEQPTRYNSYNGTIDLQQFINEHGIRVKEVVKGVGITKYRLEECLFDSNHKYPDAMLFQLDNGAVGYYCFHNSCQSHKWQEVKDLFGVNNVIKNTDRYFNKRDFIKQGTYSIETPPPIDPNVKYWLQMSDIQNLDRSKILSIKTGINQLDKDIMGLDEHEITVLTALNGHGKTILTLQMALNAIQQNYNVALYSGEMLDSRIKNLICTMAAGRNNVTKNLDYCYYYAKPSIKEYITKWLNDKFYLYNNKATEKADILLQQADKIIKEKDINLFILDNLMCLDIATFGGTSNENQKDLVLGLKELANKYRVHIILVAHPRKSLQIIRKEDISGTSDLTNVANNVFIFHRTTEDWRKRANDYFSNIGCLSHFDNILECAKNRTMGVIDTTYGLYYETETKRFLNEQAENINYNWQELMEEPTLSKISKQIPINQNFESKREQNEDWFDNENDNAF